MERKQKFLAVKVRYRNKNCDILVVTRSTVFPWLLISRFDYYQALFKFDMSNSSLRSKICSKCHLQMSMKKLIDELFTVSGTIRHTGI